jgi:hypothetical protein
MLHTTKLLFAVIVIAFAGCVKNDDTVGLFKGPETHMGNGAAYSWVKVDKIGRPKSMGITLTSTALDNLPPAGATQHLEYSLPLPKATFRTPFTEIGINWNPGGHPPTMIYGSPHFDFHFYTMDPAERLLIKDYPSDSARFKTAPDCAYLPAGYFYPGGGEPQMGAHWIDEKAAELNGAPFTETFIYGTFDGKVNFIEPMATYDFLKGVSDYTRTIPRPAKVRITGFYPYVLHIYKRNGETSIVLEKFEYRVGE